MKWVIGDIHGMIRPLEAVLDVIQRRDAEPEFFFCGDYCDRGVSTRQVVDVLLGLDRASFVRGNHDDVMDLLCNGTSLGIGTGMDARASDETIIEVYGIFRGEGMTETLLSYGVNPSEFEPLEDEPLPDWIRRQFAEVPEAHKKFFRELPAIVETPDFFVCHALWPPDQVDEDDRMNAMMADPYLRHDVLWGRYTASQIRSRKVWRRLGYFGHTPTENYAGQADLDISPQGVIRGEKVVLIDTAAFAPTGHLTALCHEDGCVIQANRLGEILDAAGESA